MNPSLILASINLSLGGLVFLLGLLILRENPRQRLNRVVSLMLFFGGFGSVLSAFGFLIARADALRGVLPTPGSVQNVAYLWEFFFPTVFLFASIFPEERTFTRRGRGLQRLVFGTSFELLVYLPHAVHFLLLFVLSLAPPSSALTPSGSSGFLATLAGVMRLVIELFLTVHQALFSLVNLGFGIGAVALLANSYQRARNPRVREQLRAIGVGLAACLLFYGLGSLIPTLLYLPITEWQRAAVTAVALTMGSGSIAYSIVRYKFLDAKLLARRGILYGVATAALVGLYLVVIVQLRGLLTRSTGVPEGVIEPVFLIVALIVFQPALSRLEDQLDRVFLRDAGDYRNVLRRLGRDLQSTIELETLLEGSIHTIAEAMMLRNAHVLAFTRTGALLHTGAGPPPPPETGPRVRAILARLSLTEESWRLADPIDNLADADRAWMIQALGISLILPLRSRGELVGALLLGDKITGTSYTSEDVALLSGLAGQMAVALQNALLVSERVQVARLEQELQLARQIQTSFLLSDFPLMDRCEVHALNIPSKQVGGDFYDFVALQDGVYVLAIADVAGKGVPAALLSSMLQASLRTQAASIPSVCEILRNINSLVYRGTTIHQFATFFIAKLDTRTMRLTFSNAGHNYPVVERRGGEQLLLERGGIVLGVVEAPDYEEDVVTLEEGDRVVLYTDGITEATNREGELFGEERLCALLRSVPRDASACAVTEMILERLRGFLDGVEPSDDMTLMVVRVTERAPARIDRGAAEPVEAAVP